jgi:hypothetical protein
MRARWVLAAALSTAGPAAAQTSEPATPAKPAPLFQAPEPEKQWELGVGFLGEVVGSFLTDLKTDQERTPKAGALGGILYPGFGGVGGGGGLMLDASWRGILGLELDVLYSRDRGKGDIDGLDIEMAQWALHLPLLFKLQLPAGMVRPYLMVGPEFVIPGDPELKVADEIINPKYGATADPYVAVAFGLGFEILLPVKDADLRIPFTLRGSYNPGVGDNIEDRAEIACTGGVCSAALKSEWEWQASATLGLAYYFHL